MPANLEFKAACGEHGENVRRAHEHGAIDHGFLIQEDTYFAVSVGRLKLRRFGDGSAELIGYSRPDVNGSRRSDYVKIPVSVPDDVLRTFSGLFGVRTVVRKRRRLFMYRGCRIHLDEVEGLGNFLEFEVPIPGEGDPRLLLTELLGMFSLGPEHAIAGSYADLSGRP